MKRRLAIVAAVSLVTPLLWLWATEALNLWRLEGLWWLSLAALPISAWLLIDRPETRTRDRRRLGLCAACGYSLAGNVSGVCPECGTPASR